MEKITYDLDKLAEGDVINTNVATRFFYTMQDYFDKLTEYTQHYQSYIQHYNPTVVVVSEAERDVFIAACATARALLTQLGMTAPLNGLNNIENAALAGEIKELSDGIIMFQGMLEIAANHITAAKNAPGTAPVKKKVILVHDDVHTLKSLSAMLKDQYIAVPLSNAKVTVTALDSHIPVLFLIFAEMESICGYELAFFIREHERFRHTPIVFLTETDTRSELHQVLTFSDMHYIVIPIEKHSLLEKVEQAIK